MQLSIRWKLIFSTVLPLIIISTIVMLLTFDKLYSNAKERLHSEATEIASHYADNLDGQFQTVAQAARSTANFLEIYTELNEQKLYEILRKNVSQNPLVYGAAIAFEPFKFSDDKKLFSPYVYRKGDELISIDIGIDSYDYTSGEWEWFTRPRELNKPIWTEPYFDKGAGNILMNTYSVPFYNNGEFMGIATIDISLDDLQKHAGIENLEDQTFMISSPTGQFIAHPNPEMIMKGNIRNHASQFNSQDFKKIVEDILSGGNGLAVINDGLKGTFFGQGTIWIFFAPIKSTGWSFMILVPELKMTEDVRGQLFIGAVALFILIFLVICSIMLVSNNLTNPIRRLAVTVNNIREGKLNSKVTDIKSTDEIGQLVTGFNAMVDQLNHHIDALSQEMAARQLVENELQVAREIQSSLLPMTFPPFPDHDEFDLHAKNEAARHVAGDFYDFFFIDKNTLMIVIADVSGKGIPAALMMAVTRTIIRNSAKTGESPAQILEETNRLLIESQTQPIYVTIFLGCYDTITGKLVYANAGHHPAYIIDSQGKVSSVANATGTIVGMLDDASYDNNRIDIATENYLVLYTDGIPEARSQKGVFFGDDNFLELLAECQGKSSSEICSYIINRVTDYQSGDIKDDMTLLILHRNK